ncbi:hypothetical protein D918_07641 [Trichuris suis]|nr:hypothetical protein D918_07641 [Trichuris suis]
MTFKLHCATGGAVLFQLDRLPRREIARTYLKQSYFEHELFGSEQNQFDELFSSLVDDSPLREICDSFVQMS